MPRISGYISARILPAPASSPCLHSRSRLVSRVGLSRSLMDHARAQRYDTRGRSITLYAIEGRTGPGVAMNQDSVHRIRELFETAVSLAPGARETFLDEQCRGDPGT